MYTFWDYMRNLWPRDAGLRIDHLLLSAKAAKRLVDAGVDRDIRGKDGASDHAPAWIILRDDATPLRKSPVPSTKTARKSAAKAKPPRAPSQATRRLVIDGDSFAHRSCHALPKTIRRDGGRSAVAILGTSRIFC
jgi:hypothetical protein